MHERSLPASPNWYCSRCSDVSSSGLLGVGAKNTIYLIEVSASSCMVVGELVGHKDLVSGFSFCQHAGKTHLCVSSSTDGSVRFWDSENKVLVKEHAAHQAAVAAVHWSPVDVNLVVSGDEKGVVVCHWHHTGDTASFFPEPRTIFCLSCSPHTWSTVAVGYKDGMIVLIDVGKKGEVMQRLRGHDDEIHSLAWSPLAGEDFLHSRPEHSEDSRVSAGDESGCYLASGSKDQTMRIWSTMKGRGVVTLKLPYVKKRGSAVDPGVKERLWLHVHWPKGRATQLVSSCFSGEVLLWDLTKTGKQKWTMFGTSSEGQNHNRIVFNMSSVLLQDRELLISTSMDREIKCWDLASLDCCWTLPTLGGFVYALTFSPVGTGCLALGVGDSMIRVWNTLTTQNQYDVRSFWQGIKSKVTALAWHPQKEGWLSFGTDDGKVGIYSVFSNKPPQISSSYHRKTVYTLAWGPPVPPMSFGCSGGGEGKTYSLYSCAGEGVILQHDPSRLSGEACDIDKLIRDTNDIKHKLSPHTDLSWKPDGKVVAIGNEDGCIDVYQAPGLKLLCSIQQHHKIINTLRWHHEHSASPELHCLLASGSSNAVVYVHDLRAILENPPESPVVLTEPYRRLCGHTSKITGMAWSPHQDARLVTVSYDGTAQVWDVLQEAAISNYRGHVGYLLSVDWSPVDPDVIWTGGKDFTLQEWRVSKQEFTKPPKGKKMADLKDKMKTNPKKKKTTKKSPGAGGAGGAAQAETNGEPAVEAPKAANGQELSVDDEEDEVGSVNLNPVPTATPLETQRKSSAVLKSKDKPDLSVQKKKKPRSMLPLSTSMDHRPKEDLLQDCINLASVKHSKEPPAGCVPGQGEHIHLGLFSDRPALYRMLEAEEEGHVEAGHYDSVVYLRLWTGDLEGALQLATDRGELSDHLLSVAPMAGFQVWRRTVEAFVKQLCLQEQYLKAASHLLSINQVYEAVDLLRSHRLYREAIALVKARLSADEPVLKELYTGWAAVLEKDGHFSSAAKCHLAAGASFDAAKVIARKNDVSSLKAAASLARISGEVSLAQSLALRCAKDLVAALDWVGAQQVLRSQESLLAHRLHLGATELLAATMADAQFVPQSCLSSHQWASPAESHISIQDHLRDVWEQHYAVSQNSTGHLGATDLLEELKSAESPTPTASVPLRQVQLYSSLHLTRAVLSGLLDDDDLLMKELWKAAAWFRDGEDFRVSAEFCRLLFPQGDVNVWSRKHPKTLQPTEEDAKAAASSLHAFIYYQRLYERWWSSSAPIQNGLPPSEPAGSEQSLYPATRRSDELDLDASLLLSDAHAAFQATQRTVREIQERLAKIVLQHSRAQGGRVESEDRDDAPPAQISDRESPDGEATSDAARRPDDEETLISLSAKMSEHQKRLADLPDAIKTYSRPDVLECCLVLLHLSKNSPSVSETLQREAKDLLRKHGTSPSVLKASRKFLTQDSG